MNATQLDIICRSHYLLLTLYLRKIRKKFNKGDVHMFRITCKKLSAYFDMLNNTGCTEFPLQVSKKISSAYHQLGKVRNLQLQIDGITNNQHANSDSQEIINGIQKKIDKLQHQFHKSFSPKACTKSMARNLTHLPAGLQTASVSLYFSKKWAKLEALINLDDFNDSQVHFVRKQLKTLYYNSALLNKYEHMPSNAITKNKNTDNLLEELGRYHDLCIADQFIKRKKLHQGMQGNSNWSKEKNLYKSRVIERIKNSFKKKVTPVTA